MPRLISDVAISHGLAVDYVNGAAPHDREALSCPYDDSRVFIDTDSEALRLVSDGHQQPAQPASFGEVLIDD
jgi:hypothetical protein